MIVSCSQRECSVINIASTDISDGLTHLRALLLVSPRVYVVYLPITSSNPRVSLSLSLSPLALSPRLLLDRGFINEPTSPYLPATSVATLRRSRRRIARRSHCLSRKNGDDLFSRHVQHSLVSSVSKNR